MDKKDTEQNEKVIEQEQCDCKCKCDDKDCKCSEDCKCEDGKCEDCKCECDCEEGECEDCKECDCEECDDIEKEFNDLNKQLDAEKAARMTLLADFMNFRKRADKEKEDAQIEANKDMLHQVVEIVDDFDRAVDMEGDKIDKNNDFYKGVMLIHKKMRDLLNSYGLSEIEVKTGAELDPMTMQAIATAPVKDKAMHNKVMQIAGKGFINKQTGKIFKTAKVIIGKA